MGKIKNPERIKNLCGKYLLHLYFVGQTPTSLLAIRNIKELCKKRLPRRCQLKLIDLREDPALAKTEQIVAAPTLVKKLPLPERRVIGDLSDFGRVFQGWN